MRNIIIERIEKIKLNEDSFKSDWWKNIFASFINDVKYETKHLICMRSVYRKLYWWNVKRTCKHQSTTEIFRCYQYVKEQCNTCNKVYFLLVVIIVLCILPSFFTISPPIFI